MNKKWVLVTPFVALALAACGRSGQQTASSAEQPPPSAEATTPVPAGSVQSVPADYVNSAVLSRQACSLDTVDGNYATQVVLDKGRAHVFRGWLENSQQKPPGTFRIALIGVNDFGIPAKTGVPRPDVASGQNNSTLADAGFNIAVDLDALPPGDYTIRFLMQTDGKTYWCNAKKSIVLK